MEQKSKKWLGRKEKTILVTMIANMVLIALRFFLADLSGSIGLEANAWHSFADLFVTTIVFVGLLVTSFGKERLGKAVNTVEHILALFVSLFIFYMGFEILESALSNDVVELRYVPFTAAGALFAVVVNYFMARLKIYVGEQTESESLKADGYHSKMDMYCSIAVLIGITGSLFGMKSLDKVAAIVAMVLLLSAGYEIFSSNLHALLHSDEKGFEHAHSHVHFSFKQNKKLIVTFGGIIVAAYALSGVYIVGVNQTGVVKRFGKIVDGEVEPGIHYSLPAPIDEVVLVNSEDIQKIDTGVQELLTGDTNLINVDMTVHYKVKNAEEFILNVENTDMLLASSTLSSIREIVGRNKIDYLLTKGKADVEKLALSKIQEDMNQNKVGIEIVSVQMVEVAPPDAVKDSYEDLASARQDRAIYISEAYAYQNQLIPEARAEAYKEIAEAEEYKTDKISTATGDAAYFALRQSAYEKTKGVTEFRLYMEAMDEILPNVQKILLGSDVKIDNAELWIGNSEKER